MELKGIVSAPKRPNERVSKAIVDLSRTCSMERRVENEAAVG